MYQVKTTGETFVSFLAASRAANAIRSDVLELETGLVRWSPAPAVSASAMARYHERIAAHAAYQRLLAA